MPTSLHEVLIDLFRLTILQARGLSVTEQERERFLSCRDLTLLEEWTRRAVSAGSAAEVLAVVSQ